MKSPLRKFGFGLHKGEGRAKRSQQAVSRRDELAQATQDMEDMRDCYDSLLAAAASTTNTAYEFSESLRELGSCLLEKTALNDDEDSGRVLLMLGKAQFQIQKFIDFYRSHIMKTITSPSQSLLSELQTVEEMKNQCDEKRTAYEHLLASQGVKGKPRNTRENISPKHVQAALDEYEDEANLFIFRLKSLKQGQSRSLLTQAVRHHAAQMNFFKKGLECLELIEPHVKLITEQQNIDYQFSELEDDDAEDEDSDAYAVNDDDELSSDFEQPQYVTDTVLATRHSMELDQADHTLAPSLSIDVTQGNQVITQRNSNARINEPKDVSFSAPILAYRDKKVDTVENLRDVKPLTPRKFNTYMLPTPGDAKNATSAGSNKIPGRLSNVNGQTNTLFHSLPLAPKKHPGANQSPERPNLSKSHSVLRESNMNNVTGWASIHLEEGLSLHKSGWRSFDDTKVKRQAFSGPLTDNKSRSSKSIPSAAGRTRPVEHPVSVSKLFTRIPVPSQRVVSPRLSLSSSPTFISSPKISELHELPRPPGSLAKIDVSSKSSFYTHSAPLASKNQRPPVAEKFLRIPQERSLLPRPPSTVRRSFSIPSSGGERSQSVSCLEPPVDLGVEAISPPLTPIPFPNSQSAMPSKVSTSKAAGDE
ncbi:uncharacterized protein At2g33490-like [Nymphaea colorata]|nr:uncharacterized protein At2g33490-like [Nymphaea colorata]